MASGTIAIRVDGADDELGLLARWLQGDDELRGCVSLCQRLTRQGEMGGWLYAVAVVLTSSTVPAFFFALFDWLGRRREVGRVSLKVSSQDGRKLELECGSTDDAQRLIDGVRDFFDDGA